MPNARAIRILVTGPEGSGKTAFVRNLVGEEFKERYLPTIGADAKFFSFNGTNYIFWDAAGAERFQSSMDGYENEASLVIACFNPLDAKLGEQLGNFLIQSGNKYEKAKALMFVFTHADCWQEELKEWGDIEKFKAEIAGKTRLPNSAISVSAKRPLAAEVFPQLEKIIRSHIIPPAAETAVIEVKTRLQVFQAKMQKRVIKADASRSLIIQDLLGKLKEDITKQQLEQAIIDAAHEIRKPDNQGKHKYGFRLFGIHIGYYKESKLFQFLEKELAIINPESNLDNLSSLTPFDLFFEQSWNPRP